MAENKRAVGSVTYQDADTATSKSASCAVTPPSGRSGRSVSARSSQETSTAGTSASTPGLRWPAHRRHRHHGHVLRPVLQHRRDVAGTAAHGRRLLLLSVRDGTLGRIHHRVGREHGIRHHPRGRRGRDGIPFARHRFRPDRSRRVVEQPGSVGGDLLHHLRRDQHHGHRDHHAVHCGDHRGGARILGSSSSPCSSRGHSTPAC